MMDPALNVLKDVNHVMNKDAITDNARLAFIKKI